MNCSSEQAVSPLSREAWLLEKFGEVMSLSDLADVLKYPSSAAVRKAHLRGTLPVGLKRLPNCSKWLVCTRTFADSLNLAFECSEIDRVEKKT